MQWVKGTYLYTNKTKEQPTERVNKGLICTKVTKIQCNIKIKLIWFNYNCYYRYYYGAAN